MNAPISTEPITLSLAESSSWCLSGLQSLCSFRCHATVSPRALFAACLLNLSLHPLSFPGWWSRALKGLSPLTSGVCAVMQPGECSLAASAQSKTWEDLDILPGRLYVPGTETSLALEDCDGFFAAGSKLSTPRSGQ